MNSCFARHPSLLLTAFVRALWQLLSDDLCANPLAKIEDSAESEQVRHSLDGARRGGVVAGICALCVSDRERADEKNV